MKVFVGLILGLLLIGPVVCPAQSAFTSFHIFGDSVSTTTNNTFGGTDYFGRRFCNGRVWVEVLAQRQGLSYVSNYNWSYFGHYSANLVMNVSNVTVPPDVSTALWVIWVNNADLYFEAVNHGTSLSQWTNAINQSQTNHLKAITNLYAKGARTLVMPNAVDISKVPFYAGSSSANKNFVRQRCLDYNAAFANTLNQARASLPGLNIHAPDVFTLLDELLTHPADYGLTNAGLDALTDPALTDKSLNGPGAHYIFWDFLDPTAKVHSLVADLAQQLISPVQIIDPTVLDGSNRLDVVNIPIGRDGFVEGSTNLVDWAPEIAISSTNATQTILVPTSGPVTFYRLHFPFVWSWP